MISVEEILAPSVEVVKLSLDLTGEASATGAADLFEAVLSPPNRSPVRVLAQPPMTMGRLIVLININRRKGVDWITNFDFTRDSYARL